MATLEQTQALVDTILDKNARLKLTDNVALFREFAERNQTLHHKLATGEFEVAIVGLEKAGKSTFANALIQRPILPRDELRCTYTQTILKNSPTQKDRVTIEFLSSEEFNNSFLELLEKIGYPEKKLLSDIINKDELSKFKNELLNFIEKNENDSTDISQTKKELKEIILYEDEIKQFLDKEILII